VGRAANCGAASQHTSGGAQIENQRRTRTRSFRVSTLRAALALPRCAGSHVSAQHVASTNGCSAKQQHQRSARQKTTTTGSSAAAARAQRQQPTTPQSSTTALRNGKPTTASSAATQQETAPGGSARQAPQQRQASERQRHNSVRRLRSAAPQRIRRASKVILHWIAQIPRIGRWSYAQLLMWLVTSLQPDAHAAAGSSTSTIACSRMKAFALFHSMHQGLARAAPGNCGHCGSPPMRCGNDRASRRILRDDAGFKAHAHSSINSSPIHASIAERHVPRAAEAATSVRS